MEDDEARRQGHDIMGHDNISSEVLKPNLPVANPPLELFSWVSP